VHEISRAFSSGSGVSFHNTLGKIGDGEFKMMELQEKFVPDFKRDEVYYVEPNGDKVVVAHGSYNIFEVLQMPYQHHTFLDNVLHKEMTPLDPHDAEELLAEHPRRLMASPVPATVETDAPPAEAGHGEHGHTDEHAEGYNEELNFPPKYDPNDPRTIQFRDEFISELKRFGVEQYKIDGIFFPKPDKSHH